MKMGKSAVMDNIPAELVQVGGEAMIDHNLQQDLEDRWVVDHMDSINGYHTPKERQLAAVPGLQNITDRSKAVLLLWYIFIYVIIFIFACCMTLRPV